jgi:hypothetical protein
MRWDFEPQAESHESEVVDGISAQGTGLFGD